jgi:hypothetical protein
VKRWKRARGGEKGEKGLERAGVADDVSQGQRIKRGRNAWVGEVCALLVVLVFGQSRECE